MPPLKMLAIEPEMLAGMTHSLGAAGLPTDDVAEPGRSFLRFEVDGLVGYGGVEGEGPDRLLRSLVFQPDRRRLGLGREFLASLEDQARAWGVARLHLLTQSTATFFEWQGYTRALRDSAPPSIAASRQFRPLCLASAHYLMKGLSA